MADSLDIEETNRLRAALGMPLLPTSNGASDLAFKAAANKDESDNGSAAEDENTLDTRHAAAGDNWKKLNDEQLALQRKEAKRAAFKKERDAAQRHSKLEGKGLGDVDDDDQDTRSWLLASKKRQKKIAKERARMMEKELEERENQAQYTERDLAGRKVAHEVGDFDAGGEHVLTLKDAVIGEDSGEDELENAELRERDKLADKLKLKKKKPVYDPNAVDEDGNTAVLGQYDEEIDGRKKKAFTLDGYGRTMEQAEKIVDTGTTRLQFSLDLLADRPQSDYIDISEIKIKKPKKKDKAKRRREDDDEIVIPEVKPDPDAMAVDSAPKRKYDDMSFVDDDDLQSNLASQRWATLKKRKRARPEDVARQIKEEAQESEPEGMDEGGLVIDETSEFVANLQKPKASERLELVKPETSTGDVQDDVEMRQSDSEDEIEHKPEPEALTATGLAEEETFNNAGIGATMGMLKQRGLVKDQDGAEYNIAQSQQADFLRRKDQLEKEWEKKAQEKRKRDRENGLFDRMSRRQQEEYAQQENRNRDQYVSRQLGELFNKSYRPNFDLKYVDEFGRRMDSKEAFKQMSHQFHGKGSGNRKTEKRLKRIEEERAREAKSSLDSSQVMGMNSAAGSQARKQRAAGVRLQ